MFQVIILLALLQVNMTIPVTVTVTVTTVPYLCRREQDISGSPSSGPWVPPTVVT